MFYSDDSAKWIGASAAIAQLVERRFHQSNRFRFQIRIAAPCECFSGYHIVANMQPSKVESRVRFSVPAPKECMKNYYQICREMLSDRLLQS